MCEAWLAVRLRNAELERGISRAFPSGFRENITRSFIKPAETRENIGFSRFFASPYHALYITR